MQSPAAGTTGRPSRRAPASRAAPIYSLPADLPPLPTGVTVPELVGGGYETRADADVDGTSAPRPSEQDARSAAGVAHRARLEQLAVRQKRAVALEESLVSSVRTMLSGGQDKRVLLSDIYAFYELMAAYCKKHLGLN